MSQFPISDHPLIVFMTDFGLDDPYVGIVKGVIHSIVPEVVIHDLTHGITPFSVAQAAYILDRSLHYFPDGTIFLTVVDPGVGTDRKPLACRSDRHIFVSPDNGLLTLVKDRLTDVREIDNRDIIRSQDMSNTFHARDVFGPAAAHLAAGMGLEAVGKAQAIDELVTLTGLYPEIIQGTGGKPDRIEGRILHVDQFGNCATNIPATLAREFYGPDWKKRTRLSAGACSFSLHDTFANIRAGEAAALVNSFGDLEICMNQADAATAVGLSIGDRVALLPS